MAGAHAPIITGVTYGNLIYYAHGCYKDQLMVTTCTIRIHPE